MAPMLPCPPSPSASVTPARSSSSSPVMPPLIAAVMLVKMDLPGKRARPPTKVELIPLPEDPPPEPPEPQAAAQPRTRSSTNRSPLVPIPADPAPTSTDPPFPARARRSARRRCRRLASSRGRCRSAPARASPRPIRGCARPTRATSSTAARKRRFGCGSASTSAGGSSRSSRSAPPTRLSWLRRGGT